MLWNLLPRWLGSMSPRVRAWLQLLRVPNLLTVPGDAMSGVALGALCGGIATGPAPFFFTAAGVVFLYAFGLILNDLHDVDEDRRLRPHRPLASGTISKDRARVSLAASLIVGLVCALLAGPFAAVMAGVLVLLIITYTNILPRGSLMASICMGLCRGGSMLIGAAATVTFWPVALPALGLTGAVASITRVAAHETHRHTFEKREFLPLAWMATTFLVGIVLASVSNVQGIFVVLALLCVTPGLISAWRASRMLGRHRVAPQAIQAVVGTHIRALIPLQAGLLVLAGKPLPVGLGIFLAVVFFPLSWMLGKQFYAS
ncbi:MAG: UbiA family prenyltransferase [Candidatus Pacebacteria bacterium]|nr:UbiA family prenyltransferase [Candidatus Paceibacterota bacterium]